MKIHRIRLAHGQHGDPFLSTVVVRDEQGTRPATAGEIAQMNAPAQFRGAPVADFEAPDVSAGGPTIPWGPLGKPDDLLPDADYYHPTSRGWEERLGERWRRLRAVIRGGQSAT